MKEMSAAELQSGMTVLSGRLLAMEYALQLLISTHHQRAALAVIWQGVLPEQLDKWLQQPAYANDQEFSQAVHGQLAHLGEMLKAEVPGF